MKKDFDTWNKIKKSVHGGENKLYIERDIWWCNLGLNVGFEQDGSGKSYERPVVVIRGFSRQVCLVAPLTTSPKKNKYYFKLGKVIGDKSSSAIISQLRLIDTKRLFRKVGILGVMDKSRCIFHTLTL